MKASSLLVTFSFLTAGFASSAFAISWAEADQACHNGLGSGCCAVAGDDGMPRTRGGTLVCSCAALAAKPDKLTPAMRQDLAKDAANLKPVPLPVAGGKR